MSTLVYIIISAVVLLALLASATTRYLNRRDVLDWDLQDDDDLPAVGDCPPVSVVIVCENEGVEMEENVPKLLEQHGVETEIIMVNAASTDTTIDAIKRLKVQYPQLRQTYVPQSYSNLNLWEFGCVLGARAARHDWVLLVHPSFAPAKVDWLSDLMRYADDGIDAVVDYGNDGYEDDEESSFAWKRRYKKMARSVLKGRAIKTAKGSLLIRKEWLLGRNTEASRYGECIYVCRRAFPFSRVILRVQNRRPDVVALS